MEITPGNIIDQLVIENIRIWMAEDIKRKPNLTAEEALAATKITNVANVKRAKLIQAFDEAMGIKTGQGDTKMYGKL